MQMDGWTVGQMVKLIVTYHNFVNVPRKLCLIPFMRCYTYTYTKIILGTVTMSKVKTANIVCRKRNVVQISTTAPRSILLYF
jgi:hypothetical protein